MANKADEYIAFPVGIDNDGVECECLHQVKALFRVTVLYRPTNSGSRSWYEWYTDGEKFWGVGRTPNGGNRLGKLIPINKQRQVGLARIEGISIHIPHILKAIKEEVERLVNFKGER